MASMIASSKVVALIFFLLVSYGSCTSIVNFNASHITADPYWVPARATWYGAPTSAGPLDNGGACGFKNVNLPPFSAMASCGNQPLFKDGKGCGSCYQQSPRNEKVQRRVHQAGQEEPRRRPRRRRRRGGDPRRLKPRLAGAPGEPDRHGQVPLRLFFAESCGVGVSSLAELRRDEREHDGGLAVALDVLTRVHQGFFDSVLGSRCSDVREVIRAVRREVLRGCTVAFSRVIPLKDVAGDHPMWKLAEQLGAVCAADTDATVTHVVALDPGTDKARWAQDSGKFLVSPKWIMAASLRWCRPCEQNFPVTRGHGH